MRAASPRTVMDYVRDAYLRYYDSAFWMRDEGIMAERKSLLQEPGVMAQEPLIEAVPVYPSVEPVRAGHARVPGLASSLRPTRRVVFGSEGHQAAQAPGPGIAICALWRRPRDEERGRHFWHGFGEDGELPAALDRQASWRSARSKPGRGESTAGGRNHLPHK